jgi:hypothetical protein
LRANGRPGVVIASLAVAMALALLLLARPWSRSVGVVTWLGGAGVLVAGAGGVMLTLRPRLVLEKESVRVHLAPGRIDPVPLEFVECFFLGSRHARDANRGTGRRPCRPADSPAVGRVERGIGELRRPVV